MKSTFCEDLAVFPDLYTDTGDLSGSIKDQMDIIQGKQIIEFPELAGYNRASREHNKAMLSRKVDRSRLSYARYATDAPRRSVPIATTNEDAFLSDPTGERRTWHFTMTRYDRDAFLRDKDQLYAEAVVREPNENLWLDTPELKAEHDAMVSSAKAPDELIDQLADLVGEVWNVNGEKEERVNVTDILMKLGLSKIDTIRLHGFGRRVADAMKTLGWRKAPKNIRCHKGSGPTAGYSRPWVEPEAPDGDDEAAPPSNKNNADDIGEPSEADIDLDERMKTKLKCLVSSDQTP
jgi:predicted P-loop ATPase